MDNTRNSIDKILQPPQVHPLDQNDLKLIERVREELVKGSINPPSWRETDPEKRRRFFDEVRSILIGQGEYRTAVNRNAQIITDALSWVGLLDQLLRDPYVEEIFVRNGQVAVEYDGTFHHLGKLADNSYFENLCYSGCRSRRRNPARRPSGGADRLTWRRTLYGHRSTAFHRRDRN